VPRDVENRGHQSPQWLIVKTGHERPDRPNGISKDDSKNRDQANYPKTSWRFVDFAAHRKTISGFARVEYLVQIQTSGLMP
jgi:hypothetical protein